MCGICGYVGDHQPELLEPMALAMQHRGPDDMGTWHNAAARVGLGFRRLSIIDLSAAGHQPMCNEHGTIWIAFNGEIYDYDKHREWLLCCFRAATSSRAAQILKCSSTSTRNTARISSRR
jgi:asparagine synthase (glutamine-hydrolysing)